MKNILQTSIALAAAALLLGSTGSQAQTAYALADNGISLIKFDLATPGVTSLIGNFSGVSFPIQRRSRGSSGGDP